MNFERQYFIHDILDAPVPYEITRESSESFIASFRIGELHYQFLAEYFERSILVEEGEEEAWGNISAWSIDFELLRAPNYGGFDVTGTGSQFTVFATIGAIMKEFIKKEKPEYFYFSAKEISRIKLYSMFAMRLAKEFRYGWWKYMRGGSTFFAFKRK